MAIGTLAEEVRRKRAAEALNGSDEEDAADDANVPSGDTSAELSEDTGSPDLGVSGDTTTETVPADEEKHDYNYLLKPVGGNVPQNVPRGTPGLDDEYVTEPSGKIIPRAQLVDPDPDVNYLQGEALRAQLASEQPQEPAGAVQLPQVDVSAQAPATLPQVERAEPVEAPSRLTQVERAEPVPGQNYILKPAAPQPEPAAQPVEKPAPIPPVKVSGITPLTSEETREPDVDIQSNGYSSGRGNQSIAKVILHSTDGTEKGDINTLTRSGNVGVHYYVTKDGRIMHFVSDADSAWQAGKDKYGGNANPYTIGIEQEHFDPSKEHPGGEAWPDAQVRATAKVTAGILARNPTLTINDVIGHSDIAGERKQDPVDYPWDHFRAYVAAYVGQGAAPPTEAVAARAEPGTKLSTGFYQNENPKEFISGRATTFATPDDVARYEATYGQEGDSGRGSPRLGALNTTQVAGVAIPLEILQHYFGNSYKDWRSARVDVIDPATGKRLRVPIVDVGPGEGPMNAGVITDMTPALARYFGGERNLALKIVPNAGPDVAKNPGLWQDEQAAIKQGFDSSSLQKGIVKVEPQQNYQLKPVEPVSHTQAVQTDAANQAAQQQVLSGLNAQYESPVALFKRLDQPVQGVNDAMRIAYQKQVRAEIIKYAQDFYKEPDPQKAFEKATSDPNFGTVMGDVFEKVGPYFNQAVTAFNQSAAVIDQNRLDALAKAVHPEASADARKTFINSILSESDPAARAAHINEIIGRLAQENPNNPALAALRATDIADSADRLANPEYQRRQKEEIDRQVAQNMRDLRPDPQLQGTAAGWWAEQLAQLPKNIVEGVTGPIGDSLMVSEIYKGTMERLRQENPGMSEDELKAKIGGSSAIQVIAMLILNRLSGGKLGTLAGQIENPAARIGASALMHTGIGGTIGAAQQAATNIAEGKPPLEGVPQAAGAGAVQALPGALLSGLHGPVRPPAVVERPPVTEERTPVLPTTQPVTRAGVLGPDVPDISVPWYKPPPIVTRGVERGTFSPSELVEALRRARESGSPEQIRTAMENLRAETNFRERTVHLAEQPEIPPQTPVTQEDVARRTYELGEERGKTGQPGTAADDYAQAQKELSQATTPLPVTQGESEPWVSAIANRFTAERAARGEVGEVIPGEGYSKEELLARGLRMGPEEINQHVSDLMNNRGGDPKLQAGAVRAEEARLSQRSNAASRASEASPDNAQLRTDANVAFQDLTDFHNGPVAKLKNNWHAQGITLQGETPVDLSTFNGLREKFLRDVGKPPPPKMEPVLRKVAKRVNDAATADKQALHNLGAEIERQTARRRLPTADEVRARIMERMKVDPCPR